MSQVDQSLSQRLSTLKLAGEECGSNQPSDGSVEQEASQASGEAAASQNSGLVSGSLRQEDALGDADSGGEEGGESPPQIEEKKAADIFKTRKRQHAQNSDEEDLYAESEKKDPNLQPELGEAYGEDDYADDREAPQGYWNRSRRRRPQDQEELQINEDQIEDDGPVDPSQASFVNPGDEEFRPEDEPLHRRGKGKSGDGPSTRKGKKRQQLEELNPDAEDYQIPEGHIEEQHHQFHEEENHLTCEIEDVQQFVCCLEAVKFVSKNITNDIVFQAHTTGLVLKSASSSGNVMTRVMIKKEFFTADTFKIELKKQSDIDRLEEEGPDAYSKIGKPLIEFSLPVEPIKSIAESMRDEQTIVSLSYPEEDSKLGLSAKEETKGHADKLIQLTPVLMPVFNVQHSLDLGQFQLGHTVGQVFGKVMHFKKALRELNFLNEEEIVEMKFSDQYPHLSFVYLNAKFQRFHQVKFNQSVEDIVYKKTADVSSFFTAGALRQAFSRVTTDSLLCILTLSSCGMLSVKHMHHQKLLLIESVLIPQEEQAVQEMRGHPGNLMGYTSNFSTKPEDPLETQDDRERGEDEELD